MSESIYEEIDRRIQELQRPDWEWVKQGPDEPKTMCAIVDYRVKRAVDESGFEYEVGDEHTALTKSTIARLNKWFGQYTDGDWNDITMWNDHDLGPQSVDDVIEVLEKFRAEL